MICTYPEKHLFLKIIRKTIVCWARQIDGSSRWSLATTKMSTINLNYPQEHSIFLQEFNLKPIPINSTKSEEPGHLNLNKIFVEG